MYWIAMALPAISAPKDAWQPAPCIMGGAGSAVGEFLASQNLSTPILHLGLPDYYVEHAKPTEMIKECGLDAAGIEAAVRARLADLHSRS